MPFFFIDDSYVKPPEEQLWRRASIPKISNTSPSNAIDPKRKLASFGYTTLDDNNNHLEQIAQSSEQINVSDIMTPDIIVLNENTSQLREALSLFVQHSFRHLPVLSDSGQLVGMLSDRDILKIIHQNRSPKGDYFSIPVRNMMISTVLSATGDTPVSEAASLMAERNIGSIPIISNNKSDLARLIGIVTKTDLYQLLAP